MRATERVPAVAGYFYPGEARELEREVRRHLASGSVGPGGPTAALAMVAPHAGYEYSGSIAGQTYARVAVPPRVVVLCPNHTGLGPRRSVFSRGSWLIPGATIEVDEELAQALLASGECEADRIAHEREHSAEVHLPFLYARQPGLRVLPVCLAHLSLEQCRALGSALAAAIRQVSAPREVLIVASTDMSHRVPAETARRLDFLALERVLALDPAGLYTVVTRQRISMCGLVPTTVALYAALELGGTRAELVAYGHSGEVTGNHKDVVGYAGLVVS